MTPSLSKMNDIKSYKKVTLMMVLRVLRKNNEHLYTSNSKPYKPGNKGVNSGQGLWTPRVRTQTEGGKAAWPVGA